MSTQTTTRSAVDRRVGEEPLGTSFPSSHKVWLEVPWQGRALRVPRRRVHLAGGEPPLDLYDTTGPAPEGPALGLPALRAPWIAERAPGPLQT